MESCTVHFLFFCVFTIIHALRRKDVSYMKQVFIFSFVLFVFIYTQRTVSGGGLNNEEVKLASAQLRDFHHRHT